MMSSHRGAVATVVLSLAVVITGCGSTVEPPQPSSSTGDAGIDRGSPVTGASDAANAIIARGAQNGELVRADLDEAAENAMACLEAAGIVPQFTPPTEEYGSYSIAWSFDVGDGPDPEKADQFDAIANSCVDAEYWPIDFRYTDQAAAIELRERQEEQWRAQGISCLVEAGIPVDENAPWDEVATALTEDFLARGDKSCHTSLGIGD